MARGGIKSDGKRLLMKKKVFISIFVSLALLTVACGSANYNLVMKEPELMFYKGEFKPAAQKLLPFVNKVGDKDRLVFLMECGLMLQAAQDYESSTKVLLEAGSVADKITTSISQQAGSLFLNETVTNYKGEDFERVLVHMYLGINFLFLKKPSEARVEFKKVNDLLRDLNVTTGKAYKQNLMAKYLTAIAFEVIAAEENDEHDWEFAYVEYKQIYELSPRLAIVYRDLQRLAKKLDDKDDYNSWIGKFGKQDNISADAGELVMIYQAGRSAVKASRGPLLSDQSMKVGIDVALRGMKPIAGVSTAAILVALKVAQNPIPVFVKRKNAIQYLMINVNGKDVARTYMLEDIENTAVKNLEDDYTRLVTKVAAGIVVKAATALAAGYAAKALAERSKKLGGFAGIIGAVAGSAVGAGLLANIKPDLRCWHTLPANLQLSRVFLPPGQYNITIKFIDNAGMVERTTTHLIQIDKGKKTFFNFRTLY
jgi:uncharacterized protein